MDLLPLNEDFKATGVVENWSSLIWAERYTEAGDFQLSTAAIEQTMEELPIDSYVGLRQSNEVMVVEDHDIQTDPDSDRPERKLVVKGRTLETLSEHRAHRWVDADGDPGGESGTLITGGTASSIAYTLYHEAMTGFSLFSGTYDPDAQTAVSYLHADDIVGVTEPTIAEYNSPPGQLYPEILKLLQQNEIGIRNDRFNYSDPFNPNIKCETWFYSGDDRTVEQTDWPEVVFDVKSGDIMDPSYFITGKNYKNCAIVYTGARIIKVFAPGVPTNTKGKALRVLYVDAKDIVGGTTTSLTNRLRARGLSELAKNNKIRVIDGEISTLTDKKYGTDYFLGDLVTLRGEFGVTQTMRVTEYIRTEDADTGYRDYPTLSALKSEA